MQFMCCFNVNVKKAPPAHASFCLTVLCLLYGTNLRSWACCLIFLFTRQWVIKSVKLNHFFPPHSYISQVTRKKKGKKRFPEICFLDWRSLVVLNVTLSKRALWMMLNVLWLPAFVSVLPECCAETLIGWPHPPPLDLTANE